MCVCVCARVCVSTSLGHQIWFLFRPFPIFTLTPLGPWSFTFFLSVAPRVALSDRRNRFSQTVIMWCELWLPPGSPATIRWHRANVSRAVRKPHDGDDCWGRRGGGEGKKEGGKEKPGSCIFYDVVPPIVLSVWLSLIDRLFALPMASMPLHQSFDLQFQAALVRIIMLMCCLSKCVWIRYNVHQGRGSRPRN